MERGWRDLIVGGGGGLHLPKVLDWLGSRVGTREQ